MIDKIVAIANHDFSLWLDPDTLKFSSPEPIQFLCDTAKAQMVVGTYGIPFFRKNMHVMLDPSSAEERKESIDKKWQTNNRHMMHRMSKSAAHALFNFNEHKYAVRVNDMKPHLVELLRSFFPDLPDHKFRTNEKNKYVSFSDDETQMLVVLAEIPVIDIAAERVRHESGQNEYIYA